MSVSQNFPTIFPSLSLDFASVKKLDSRVTFARASTATYYDGKTVAKAEENLLLRSQEFDQAAWGKNAVGTGSQAVVTANTGVAPDGTTTADRLVLALNGGTSINDRSFIFQNIVTTESAIYSVYIKSNTVATQVTLRSGTTNTSIAVTTDWQRFVVTKNINDSACTIELRGSQSPANSDSADLLIWGAQLEQRSAVTAYTPTTTQPITNYIPTLLTAPANVARFDHNPVTGESLGLEVEEQRTNLQTYSEDFGNASWLKVNATIEANVIVAPDGILTGDKLVESATSGEHKVYQNITTIAGVYTYSVFAKAGGRDYLVLRENLDGNFVNTFFNLATGSIVSTGASRTSSIVNCGNNVYRCAVIATATAASKAMGIGASNTGTTVSYLGDGYSGIYLWGAQLEAGAFPTSYIKTVASQVTRAADSASMVGANFSEWYRADEGTLYGEFYESYNTSILTIINNGGVSLNTNGTTPCIEIIPRPNDVNFSARGVGGGGVSSISVPIPAVARPAGTTSRTALTYTTDPLGSITAVSLNGTISTNALKSANSMIGINQLEIGKQVTSGVTIGTRYFRKVSYYPIAVTSTQLQSLTS